jgi:hypothetical protein
MIQSKRIIFSLLLILLTSISAIAQSSRVSLKPLLKPDQEYRYVINASVDTRVQPTNANGIASNVHRETTATVLLRGVANEKSGFTNEAVIEAITTRTTVDGIDRPATGSSLVGLKIEYRLDQMGRLVKASFTKAAVETGLAELIFNLTKWVPTTEVEVGQTWGTGSAGESLIGDYGYFYASAVSDITKGATLSYRLSRVDGDKALVEGAIALNQSGAALLTTKDGGLSVNVIAAGKGSTRVEYDVAASRIVEATTETSLEGRLANIPPAAAGQKLQPREGSLAETAKFSVKLVK